MHYTYILLHVRRVSSHIFILKVVGIRDVRKKCNMFWKSVQNNWVICQWCTIWYSCLTYFIVPEEKQYLVRKRLDIFITYVYLESNCSARDFCKWVSSELLVKRMGTKIQQKNIGTKRFQNIIYSWFDVEIFIFLLLVLWNQSVLV